MYFCVQKINKIMAKAKKIMSCIISAFSLFTFTSHEIEVDTTSTVEQAWSNVGGYIRNAMNHYESEIQ
jgi:hypothetical protein